MSDALFSLRRATEEDLLEICELYHTTHQGNSAIHRLFHRYGWDEDSKCGLAFVKQYLGNNENLVAAVAITPSNQIIGFAMWSHIIARDLLPARRAINGEDIAQIGKDHDDPIYGEILRDWISAEDRQLRKWSQHHASFWYLTLIGVHEDHRGKGIARKLTSWGRKRASWPTDHGVEGQESLFIMSSNETADHWLRNGWVQTGDAFRQTINPTIEKIPMIFSPVARIKDETSLRTYENDVRDGKGDPSIVVEL